MAAGRARGLAVWILGVACLVLQLDFISGVSQPIFGAVNKSVTLNTSGSVPIKEIMWKKGKDKVVEWEEEDPKVKDYPPFVGRIHLDLTSGSLTISDLTVSDDGDYEVDSPSITNTRFHLRVIEPLPLPILTCTLTAEDILVRCRIPESYYNYTGLIKYSWNCFSAPCQNSSNASEVSVKRENDLSREVQCAISNPLSQRSSSLVLASCVPDNSRSHLVIIGAIILTVIVGTVLLLYGKGRLKCGGERHGAEKEARSDGNSDALCPEAGGTARQSRGMEQGFRLGRSS